MAVHESTVALQSTSVTQREQMEAPTVLRCFSGTGPPQEGTTSLPWEEEARYNCLGTRDKQTIFGFGAWA